MSRMLHSLNLPSSLEALERPIGLPPSLLKKAEEVRREEGPRSIESSIEDVQRLAHQDVALLNEVRICVPGSVS
jgi:programmed cell death 6-interacting protein